MNLCYTPNPISIADELIALANRATDERRDAEPYLIRAEAILDAYAAADDDVAATLVSDAVAWLAR